MARAALACILAVVGCASSQSGADSTLPSIPEPTSPDAAECRVSIGDPQGVRVTELVGATSAAEVLKQGDIIVGLGTRAITSLDSLLIELNDQIAGETISVRFLRDEAEMNAELTTTADSEGRARLGLRGRTHYASVPPREAPRSDLGQLTRVVDLEGRLYGFDPSGPSWASLGIRAPGSFVPFGDEVYTLSGGEPYLVGLLGNKGVPLATGTWRAYVAIASVDDLLVVGARGSEGRDGEYALLGIDPATGTARWEFPVQTGPSFAPAFGYTSPDGLRVLVDVASPTEHQWYVLDEDGGDLLGGEFETPSTGLAFGWFDNDRVLVVSQGESEAFLFNLANGKTTTVVPTEILDLEVAQLQGAVGNGSQLFVRVGNEVVLAPAFEESEWRPVTTGCQRVIFGDFGWKNTVWPSYPETAESPLGASPLGEDPSRGAPATSA